jgi:hypothetical protein
MESPRFNRPSRILMPIEAQPQRSMDELSNFNTYLSFIDHFVLHF